MTDEINALARAVDAKAQRQIVGYTLQLKGVARRVALLLGVAVMIGALLGSLLAAGFAAVIR